jgi:hypothetical protein
MATEGYGSLRKGPPRGTETFAMSTKPSRIANPLSQRERDGVREDYTDENPVPVRGEGELNPRGHQSALTSLLNSDSWILDSSPFANLFQLNFANVSAILTW